MGRTGVDLKKATRYGCRRREVTGLETTERQVFRWEFFLPTSADLTPEVAKLPEER